MMCTDRFCSSERVVDEGCASSVTGVRGPSSKSRTVPVSHTVDDPAKHPQTITPMSRDVIERISNLLLVSDDE